MICEVCGKTIGVYDTIKEIKGANCCESCAYDLYNKKEEKEMTSYEKCKAFFDSTGEPYYESVDGDKKIIEESYSQISFIFKNDGSFVQIQPYI